MLDLIVYLLPLSGELLLRELLDLDSVRIKTALLPENFFKECQALPPLLEENNIRYKFPEGDLNSSRLKNWVDKQSHDLGVSIGYDKKLPGWLINHPRLKNINIHPSLLPNYRGANPYFWVVKNQETKTGVTLHLMDENFDTGPIIEQEEIALDEQTLMGDIFIRLNQMGSRMAAEKIKWIAEKDELPPTREQPQLENPPEAPRVNDQHLRIDWSQKFDEINALVRAGNPFFGAFSLFRGQKLQIYEIQEAPEIDETETKPGRIITTDRGPVVRCGDSWVRLNSVCLQYHYQLSGLEFQRREKEALEVLKQLI
ncbi:MAG: methionyl-tRNA formyltransferase [bacterium]